MVIDIGVVIVIAAFAAVGYSRGLLRGLLSLVTPVLGIWLALRRCDDLAALIQPTITNPTLARVVAFVVVFLAVLLVLRLAHHLLLKFVDWTRYCDLDQYLGAFLGLAKGAAFAWVALAMILSVFPASVRAIGQSRASVRLLAFGERLSGGVAPLLRDQRHTAAPTAARPGDLPRRAGARTELADIR